MEYSRMTGVAIVIEFVYHSLCTIGMDGHGLRCTYIAALRYFQAESDY